MFQAQLKQFAPDVAIRSVGFTLFYGVMWAAHRTLMSYNQTYISNSVLGLPGEHKDITWNDVVLIRPTLVKWDWFIPIVFSAIFMATLWRLLTSLRWRWPSGCGLMVGGGAGFGALAGLTTWIHARILSLAVRDEYIADWITAGALALAVVSLAWLSLQHLVRLHGWVRNWCGWHLP